LSYDLEVEFDGKGACNLGAPILCATLKCSCGNYCHVVSRSRVEIEGVTCSVVDDNESMAVEVISRIMSHAPIVTVGHNIYMFDNFILAMALHNRPELHCLFKPINDRLGAGSTSLGFTLNIPGTVNLDTFRYIKQSMNGDFSQFSLSYLCRTLELKSLKIDDADIVFNLDWFMGSSSRSTNMVVYNIADCSANMELVEHLNILPQMYAIAYAARACIEDVIVYRTGALAASALAKSARLNGFRYHWTRCDWIPYTFCGGEVLFTSTMCASNVLICDFVSMYPSIMWSGGISPESVDYIDHSTLGTVRFTSMEMNVCICHVPGLVHLGLTFYGLKIIGRAQNNDGFYYTHIPVAWFGGNVETNDTKQVRAFCEEKVKGWQRSEP
jgi:DNA polymerase elongation subunit (family B)